MADRIKKKNEPDGFDRFNRVSKTVNIILNIIFILALSFSILFNILQWAYR